MLDDHSLKIVFIIIVVVVCTFFWTNISAAMSGAVFLNPLHSPRLLFWLFAVDTLTFLCVYDMRIVLLKWNAHEVTQSSSGDVVCVFMSSLRRHARFSVSVLKENVHLCHPFMHKYDCALS